MLITFLGLFMTLLHLQQFWGESQQVFLGLNGLPDLSIRQEKELHEWCKGRRKILKHEAHSQPWLKIGHVGEPTQITLKPNGSAIEESVFGTTKAKGNWNIQDGFLFILLENEDQITEYRVIGNASSNVHSGSEYINGKPNSLVKLAQIKPQ